MTTKLKNIAEPSPPDEEGGGAHAATHHQGLQHRLNRLLQDSELCNNLEDDDSVLSETDTAYSDDADLDLSEEGLASTEGYLYGEGRWITVNKAIMRAKTMIPSDLALQQATIDCIQQLFAAATDSDEYDKNEFLRRTIKKVRRVHAQFVATGDKETGMPSKAELLAIRCSNPGKSRYSKLCGYLELMNHAGLTYPEDPRKGAKNMQDAITNYSNTMDDVKKRLSALEGSTYPQGAQDVANEVAIIENAIQDFRDAVKGALDRRASIDDLENAMAKQAKDIDALRKKQAQDLKDVEHRLQASHDQAIKRLQDQLTAAARGTQPAGWGTITGRTPRRPLTNASDTSNKRRAASKFNVRDLSPDADLGAPVKKRRVDGGMDKMDFSDIV
ncbi:hypothetical protein QBC39DRAFT_88837 [Podospora conica]|nr:hypothetical protein QBC39DRAFT_88837 [Schizothecium conicum]